MTQYLKDLVKIDNQDDLYEEIEIEEFDYFVHVIFQSYTYILQMYYLLIAIKKFITN